MSEARAKALPVRKLIVQIFVQRCCYEMLDRRSDCVCGVAQADVLSDPRTNYGAQNGLFAREGLFPVPPVRMTLDGMVPQCPCVFRY